MEAADPGFITTLGIEYAELSSARAVATMPIDPRVLQPYGFLHGGATIALLETAASAAAGKLADLDRERPFGIDVHVRHRKSGKSRYGDRSCRTRSRRGVEAVLEGGRL